MCACFNYSCYCDGGVLCRQQFWVIRKLVRPRTFCCIGHICRQYADILCEYNLWSSFRMVHRRNCSLQTCGIIGYPGGFDNDWSFLVIRWREMNQQDATNLMVKTNETPTWCNTVQISFLQGHSTCFGRKRPSSGVSKTSTAATGTCVIVTGQSSHLLIRICDDLPATITHVPVAAVLVLDTPDDGRLRPKHVEWSCRNEIFTVLHQVCVSFVLYYDARKHKIKI